MQATKQAIRLTRERDGWTWTLLDGRGEAAGRGSAPKQDQAMEAAWSLAKVRFDKSWRAYPEIIVENPAPERQQR